VETKVQWKDYLSFIINNFDDILMKRPEECKEYTLKMVELLSNNSELKTQFMEKMNILLDEYKIIKIKSFLPNNREYIKIKRCFINKDTNLYLLSNIKGCVYKETLSLVFGFEYEKNIMMIFIDKNAKESPLMSGFIKLIAFKDR